MSGVVEEEVCEDCEVGFSVSEEGSFAPDGPSPSASTVRMFSGWDNVCAPLCLILRIAGSGSSLEKPLSS